MIASVVDGNMSGWFPKFRFTKFVSSLESSRKKNTKQYFQNRNGNIRFKFCSKVGKGLKASPGLLLNPMWFNSIFLEEVTL